MKVLFGHSIYVEDLLKCVPQQLIASGLGCAVEPIGLSVYRP